MNTVRDEHLPWPSPARAWSVVAVLMLGYFCAYVDRQILSLLVVPIQADLGATDLQLGLLQGLAFAIFYTLLGVPLGWVADRASRRNLLIAGVTVWSLATAACGLADSYAELFVARVLVGVGEATLAPAALSLIADHFPPEKRAVAMSVYVASGSIGAGSALMLGGVALDHANSIVGLAGFAPWQATFIVAGLPGLVVALLLLAVREPVRRERARADAAHAADFGHFLRHHRGLLLLHFGGMAAFSAMSYAVLSWIPVFLVRHHGMPLSQAGFAFGAAFAVGGLVGAIAGGFVARQLKLAGHADGALRAAVIGTALSGLCYALAPTLASPAAAIAAFGFGTLFAAFPSGPSVAALNEVAPNELRGRVTALYYFAINLVGLALGPVLVGAMTDHVFADRAAVGQSMLWTALVLGPLSAVLLWRAQRPYRSAMQQSPVTAFRSLEPA